MSGVVQIGGREVGEGRPVLVVAEAGVNHNGDVRVAERLVDAAAEAGADAVKFQMFAADRLAAPHAHKAPYQRRTTDAAETQRDMLRRLQLDADVFAALAERCREAGILFLASVFDECSADELLALGAPAVKLGSGELTNEPLLAHVAGLGRPVILSTGMADLDEVRTAVELVQSAGASVILLHCVSDYPSDPADANLRAIPTMREDLDVPVGYSDHTTGPETALAAIGLGACVLEKHLTLDRSLPGPDHGASLEPDELAALVASVRTVERALGDGVKRPAASELANRRLVRRSLHAAADIAAGATLDAETIVVMRPADGIPPSELNHVVGRTARRAIASGEAILWDDLA